MSSKRRAFHVSTNLLTAGALVGGVALGAGCKSDKSSSHGGGPKGDECCVNPGPIDQSPVRTADLGVVAQPPARATDQGGVEPPPKEPDRVNPGPVDVPDPAITPKPLLPVERPVTVNPGPPKAPALPTEDQDMG